MINKQPTKEQCKCLDTILAWIKKEFDDEKADLTNTTTLTNFRTGAQRTTAPVLRFKYREKKKDGTFKKAETSSYMHLEFCPFCGERYKKNEN